MRILILGGNGFIGSAMATHLQQHGHQVVHGIRNAKRLNQLPTDCEHRIIDFCLDLDASTWRSHCSNIDAIINCAGVMECPPERMDRIHHTGPKALFQAAHQAGIKRLIHISALGIEQSPCAFATTKLALDQWLLASDIPITIVRPSLVYDRNSYGGSALIRGLAGLPWLTPLPAGGIQQFQAIGRDDLCRAVTHYLNEPSKTPRMMMAVGPEKLSLTHIIHKTQAWLRWRKSRVLSIPIRLFRLLGHLGSTIRHPSINATAIDMMLRNNTASDKDTLHFMQSVPFPIKNFTDTLTQHNSAVQDRWHARLYFLKPAARWLLGIMWLLAAITTVINHQDISHTLLKQANITNSTWQTLWLYGGSFLDLILGTLLLCNKHTKVVLQCQLGLVIAYTAIISCMVPIWWLNPIGPVAKNLPIIALTLVLLALESDR